MALWGDRDNFQSVAVGVATVNLSAKTIEIKPGPFTAGIGTNSPMIKLGLGATCGYAQIVGVTSAALISIASTDALIPDATGAIAGVAYSLTTMPVSLDEDPLGVSQERTGIATVRYFGVGSTAMTIGYQGLATATGYRPTHSGWVGVQTYIDNHGNLRVKSEVFVAMSGIQTGNEPYPNYA